MRRLFGSFALVALTLAACKTTTSLTGGDTSSGGGGTGAGGSTGGTGGAGGGSVIMANKVDLLFSIDNSRSMADKQQILSLALPDLISGLANPPCLDSGGNVVVTPGPLEPCPSGSSRRFSPVTDIHIGIISSSLGGHGSDACSTVGAGKQSNNDRGRLLHRVDPLQDNDVPTYEDTGFLAWDPTASLDPPGETNQSALVQRFSDMVLGVGQIGCGYESQLESVYRFLAEPTPPLDVTLDSDGLVVWQGLDTVLLDQRRSFLRPDSMLVVVTMSDENDCSIREEGQFYYAAQQKASNGSPFHLPKPRSICEQEPNDVCCYSCGQQGPKDDNGDPLCADDPLCKTDNGQTAYLDDQTDNINQRCFDQKRRFGIDFLHPIDRYVNAFTGPTITTKDGEVVANPIFTDLEPDDGAQPIRDPGLVLVTGIVGVPWQDIAKNPQDLKQGFKTAGELTQKNVNGYTVWDIVLGDPQSYVPPLDPFMQESIFPRSGVNPVTGDATTLPAFTNPINGHEFANTQQDDLQYACIMPILAPIHCADGSSVSCDCEDPNNDNPLCAPDPTNGDLPTLQVAAKAMPGLRQLAVLKGLGDRAVIGSICAGQIDDSGSPDYGYRPVVLSLIDRMRLRLQ